MLNLPPLTALRAFEAAARYKSFSLASDELCVTASAISHQIKLLEEYLGVALFYRRVRQVELTPEAKFYLPRIQQALESIVIASQNIKHNGAQVLNLSLAPAFASKWLIPRLHDFQQHFPDLEVKLSCSLDLVDFNSSEYDLAVRYGDGHWDGLKSHLLLQEDIVPLCHPKLLTAAKSVKDLLEQRLLFIRVRNKDWSDWFAAQGIDSAKITPAAQLDNIPLVLEAACAGMGFALVSRQLAQDELDRGALVAPFEFSTRAANAYYLVYPERNKEQEKIRVFRDWLLSQLLN